MKLRGRKKQAGGWSADQLREALGALTTQTRPRRRWVPAARSWAWQQRWALVPLAAMVAVWVTASVLLAAGGSVLLAGLVAAAALAGSVLLARPLPENDQPWVWVPVFFAGVYLVVTVALGH